jgi:peptidoglycan hydrolase-like protein with peptidoglycan-binding domain
VPDPQGRGLHPLVYRGTSRRRSRNPTTGDAQILLNNFLNDLSSGAYRCRSGADTAAIQRIRATLSQDPLEVDCRFGPNTEKVTKMFQRCVFPGQSNEWDGKIGPMTWRELERLRARPVVPVPPSPPVTPPPPRPRVPTEINELLRKINEALNRIHRLIPPHLRRFIPATGIVVPTRARFLTPAEQAEARTIYGASLDFSHIVITNGLGFSGRGFTVAVRVGADWWVAMNIGSLAPRATRPASDLLIHELAHAWQSQHHGSDKTAFMQNSLFNQAAAEALNAIGQPASAYAYIPGKPFREYGAEQIAEQIEDSYNGTGRPTPTIVPHVRSVAVHAADADNEASLTVLTGFERLSTPGVVPP